MNSFKWVGQFFSKMRYCFPPLSIFLKILKYLATILFKIKIKNIYVYNNIVTQIQTDTNAK